MFIIAWYKDLVKASTFKFPYGIDINGNTIYDKTKDLSDRVIKTKVSDIFEPEDTIDAYYTISDSYGKDIKEERKGTKPMVRALATAFLIRKVYIVVLFLLVIGKMEVRF